MSERDGAMIPVSTFTAGTVIEITESVTPRLYRRSMVAETSQTPQLAYPIPVSLSPSSMGTFTSCPLAFRFSYIERLPEPPTAPASKGTLVHLALQHLMWRPPAERTVEAALSDLARARR